MLRYDVPGRLLPLDSRSICKEYVYPLRELLFDALQVGI